MSLIQVYASVSLLFKCTFTDKLSLSIAIVSSVSTYFTEHLCLSFSQNVQVRKVEDPGEGHNWGQVF